MKLLLIYPPRRADSYMNPPTPLLYVSQAARRAGHEAEIVDVPYLLEKYPDQYSLEDESTGDPYNPLSHPTFLITIRINLVEEICNNQ